MPRHRLHGLSLLTLAAALTAAACSDTRPASGPAGGSGGGGGGGTAGNLAPPAPSGLAVVNGDFMSAGISLLTLSGELSNGDCVHTTKTTPDATPSISGDVVLPSQPQHGGKLVLVDRGNTALTFVDPTTCAVDHQISVKGGFNFADPHDVVILGDGKAYVTRYGVNAAPTGPTTTGDDVLIVDPRDGTVVGHIDLAPYAVPTEGVIMHSRPDRALIAAGKVVVSLNETSDFPTDLSGSITYGEGHVVAIDPATDSVVQDLALRGLKGCEAMTYLEDAKLLLVVCGGSFGADAAADSGIAVVDMSGTAAVLAKTISATNFDHHPASFQSIVGIASEAGRRAFIETFDAAATPGATTTPDQAFVVDLDEGSATAFATSTAFDLGAAALTGTLFILPDATASRPRVRVFDVSGTATENGSFPTQAANGLPPRLVAAY